MTLSDEKKEVMVEKNVFRTSKKQILANR